MLKTHTHKGLCITIIPSVADVFLKNNSSVYLETHFYGFLKKDHETFAYSTNGFCINSCTFVSKHVDYYMGKINSMEASQVYVRVLPVYGFLFIEV